MLPIKKAGLNHRIFAGNSRMITLFPKDMAQNIEDHSKDLQTATT